MLTGFFPPIDYSEPEKNTVPRVDFVEALKGFKAESKALELISSFWERGWSIEAARNELHARGFRTPDDKREAIDARFAAWAEKRKVTAEQFQAQCRAALLKVIAKNEPKPMTDDCRRIVEATKRQVLGA